MEFFLLRMNTQFGVPVINILWTIVAGRRFQSEDPQVQRMMVLLNRSAILDIYFAFVIKEFPELQYCI